MLDIGVFYWLLAAFLLYAAFRNARERRWMHAGFWGVLALLFGSGDWIIAAGKAGDILPEQIAGVGVIALALLATRMRREHIAEAPVEQRQASAQRLGHWLFLPALLIPLLTVLAVLFGPKLVIAGRPLFGNGSATLIGLALASIVAAKYGWQAVFVIAMALNATAALLALFVIKPMRRAFILGHEAAAAGGTTQKIKAA